MPNRSYLCGTNVRTTYPSTLDPEFEPDRDLLASDVLGIPLLWLAMFRPADVVRRVVHSKEGEDIATEAPLAPRDRAISQLDEAVPFLDAMFAAEGSVREYGRFLELLLTEVDLLS